MVDIEPVLPTYTSLTRPLDVPAEAPRRRAVLPWLLTAIAVAFAVGLLANPWFEHAVRGRLPGMPTADAPAGAAAVGVHPARSPAPQGGPGSSPHAGHNHPPAV